MPGADDLTTFMCRMSWKSGSLNLLEPSGPHRTCYGIPFTCFSTLQYQITRGNKASGCPVLFCSKVLTAVISINPRTALVYSPSWINIYILGFTAYFGSTLCVQSLQASKQPTAVSHIWNLCVYIMLLLLELFMDWLITGLYRVAHEMSYHWLCT